VQNSLCAQNGHADFPTVGGRSRDKSEERCRELLCKSHLSAQAKHIRAVCALVLQKRAFQKVCYWLGFCCETQFIVPNWAIHNNFLKPKIVKVGTPEKNWWDESIFRLPELSNFLGFVGKLKIFNE